MPQSDWRVPGKWMSARHSALACGRRTAQLETMRVAAKQTFGSVGFWPIAGAAVIEIVATLLTVKLLVQMSGMEQAVPEEDWLLSV